MNNCNGEIILDLTKEETVVIVDKNDNIIGESTRKDMVNFD